MTRHRNQCGLLRKAILRQHLSRPSNKRLAEAHKQSNEKKRPRLAKNDKNINHNDFRGVNLRFPCDPKYTCQVSMLLLLEARSFGTLRMTMHDDNHRFIRAEFKKTVLSLSEYFPNGKRLIPQSHLDVYEERLIEILTALQTNRIYYPLTVDSIMLAPLPRIALTDEVPTLYLHHNIRAQWASDANLPPTWKDDQIDQAKCLIRSIELVCQLNASRNPVALGLQDQSTLAKYIKELSPSSYHVGTIRKKIFPMTGSLAVKVMLDIVASGKGYWARLFFETLFGSCSPMTGVEANPDNVYKVYLEKRRNYYVFECEENGVIMSDEFEQDDVLLSHNDLALLLAARTRAAVLLIHESDRDWRIMSNIFTRAFGDDEEQDEEEDKKKIGEFREEGDNNDEEE